MTIGVTTWFIDSFKILLSSKVKPISLSITIKAIEAFSNDLMASEEEYLSIWFFWVLRGIPAVSVIW